MGANEIGQGKGPAAAEQALFRSTFAALRSEVGRMIVGQREVVDGVLTALLAGGHVLLEGVPGLGKTMLVGSIA
ncbi:MoxR family ATPase, partial [Stenotrophomonas sp. MMGLT7]|nr:MoxR family ATPase [Stenotrophomonas sp. MMGLT7]